MRLLLQVDPSVNLAKNHAVVDEGWEDPQGAAAGEANDPELKKVLDIFPGKIHKRQ